MGLLDKLFGKKKDEGAGRRQAIAKALRDATASPCGGASAIDSLDKCFPDPRNSDDVLEGINQLFELERNDWAEGLALRTANAPWCSPSVRKGLLKHFVGEGRTAEVLDGIAAFLDARPSEADLAVELARALLRRKDYARVPEVLSDPLKSSPDNMVLYGLAGEAYVRTERWQEAVDHLRTACELYEWAFRHGTVAAAEMNNEQMEFSRLYGLLEQAARKLHGPESYREAFETLHMEPQNFGILKEAERLAIARIEYRPWTNELMPVGEQYEAMAKEKGGDPLDVQSRLQIARAVAAMRGGQLDDAMLLFRETLEIDVESYPAYLGWNACERLRRLEALPGEDRPIPAEAEPLLRPVLPDWDAFTPRERFLATVPLAQIRPFLPRLAEAGRTMRVHPIDVRLTDLYAERVETRFDRTDCHPQGLGAFATRNTAHVRLDEFLTPDPDTGWSYARMVGLMVCDALDESERRRAREIFQASRALTGKGSEPPNLERFLACVAEAATLRSLFGSNPANEWMNDWESIGAFAFLSELR